MFQLSRHVGDMLVRRSMELRYYRKIYYYILLPPVSSYQSPARMSLIVSRDCHRPPSSTEKLELSLPILGDFWLSIGILVSSQVRW